MTNKIKKLKDNTYQFQHWMKIDKTYSGAVVKMLAQIKATRPFYNWREGQIDEAHLRETPRKAAAIKKLTKKGIVTIEVQLGQKYKGRAVEDVRKSFAANEFGLGAYEMACILLADPDILKSYDDLWLDCPGDEFDVSGSSDRFGHAPFLGFSDGEVKFVAGHVSTAHGGFGSASATIPSAVNFDSCELGSNDNLTLDSKNAKLKLCPTKTKSQVFKLSTTELGEGVTLRVTVDIISTGGEE